MVNYIQGFVNYWLSYWWIIIVFVNCYIDNWWTTHGCVWYYMFYWWTFNSTINIKRLYRCITKLSFYPTIFLNSKNKNNNHGTSEFQSKSKRSSSSRYFPSYLNKKKVISDYDCKLITVVSFFIPPTHVPKTPTPYNVSILDYSNG